VTNGFAFCAVFAGGSAGHRVSEATLDTAPPLPPDPPPGHELDPKYIEQLANLDLHVPILHPSTGWAIAAGLGVALAYFLSILLHELGHYLTARALRVRASGIQLDFAGGFVSLGDETTAGRFAAIVAAGPLVTGALALGSFAALKAFGWPLLDTPFEKTGAAVVAGEILSYVLFLNTIAFVLNLLPLPSLDGGKLLRALTSHA